MRFTTRIWNGRGLLAGAALVAALSLGAVAPLTPSLADELASAPEETTLAEEPASEDGETEDAGDDLGVNSVTSIAEKDVESDAPSEDAETTPTEDGDDQGDDPSLKIAPEGLVEDDSGLRYSNGDGTYLAGEWKDVEGERYYFDDDGYALRWQNYVDGELYYFDGGCRMHTGWLTWNSDSTRTYFGADGAALEGWQEVEGDTYYFDPSNECHGARWETVVEGKRYYFDGSCRMVTGLVEWNDDGRKSFFGTDGAAVSGWRTVDGDRYYFSAEDGRSLRWQNYVDGELYYFDGGCRMHTGWLTWNSDSTRTYFGADGAALEGWQEVEGDTYYFDPDDWCHGALWSRVIDGKTYYFDRHCRMVIGPLRWNSDGTWQFFGADGALDTSRGWKSHGGSRYYVGADGDLVQWEQEIDGKTYYFNSECRMWAGPLRWNSDGTWQFFGPDGALVTAAGWQSCGGRKYYVGSNGDLVRWKQKIDGKTYYFDSQCRMHTGWLKWNNGSGTSYFGPDGVMYTGSHTIDGYPRTFTSDGICLKSGYQVKWKGLELSTKKVVLPSYAQGSYWSYVHPVTISADATRAECIEAFIDVAYEYMAAGTRWVDNQCSRPGTTIDCTGLVMEGLYACGMDLTGAAGGDYNPYTKYYKNHHFANTWRKNQTFQPVSLSKIERGDIIYYEGHVAIYLGNGKIIESHPVASNVHICSMYRPGTILGVARPFTK